MRRFSAGVAALITAVGLVWAGGPAFAAGSASALTCTGGPIMSGDYSSITVTGPCFVAEDAVVTVSGSINVMRGAILDAQSEASTITVMRNVTAGTGAMLGLGCQPAALVGNTAHACGVTEANPDGNDAHSVISVHGNISVSGAAVVLLNGITVGQNVTISGGGDPNIPWSIKNNAIGGNLTISGQTTNWLGVLFNQVGKNVTLSNITLTEDHPGAAHVVYVGYNVIARNLICSGLPGVSPGFRPGAANTVGGRGIGQCAGIVGN